MGNKKSEKDAKSTKLAVILPGIGYHCDKPLLYYSGKLAEQNGFEVVRVPYAGFPKKVKGDTARMRSSYDIAMTQTEEMLRKIDFSAYTDVVFISKSIGTVVAVQYQKKHKIKARNIIYTPLAETFPVGGSAGVVFHGSADPWAEDDALIRNLCDRDGIPMYLVNDGNHSLETGDALQDVINLAEVMKITRDFLVR